MTDACDFDVAIIGAGAAGLMCALTAGKRNKRTILIDHAAKIGEKIRISGGGRCNFTNIDSTPENFLSQNPKFCISALSQFTPRHIIALLEKHAISWHDKGAGQLFCDTSARQVVDMLVTECKSAAVRLRTDTNIAGINRRHERFYIECGGEQITARSLVVATGGLSVPKIGASGFGHTLARQFGHTVTDLRPGLVPLTFSGPLLDDLKSLTGISVMAAVCAGKTTFTDKLLFTHRGLSGPAILQISSYWVEGTDIFINLLAHDNLFNLLVEHKTRSGKRQVSNVVADFLPARLADFICASEKVTGRLGDLGHNQLRRLGNAVNHWQIRPQGTEGYRTAEVTLGGVDTKDISSQTMESSIVPNLYFIGEVVDVTGQLGGHNFQWAWASGHCAGRAV